MIAKRFLIFILVCSLMVSSCACGMKDDPTDPPVTTTTRVSVRNFPDYTPELRDHLGVEPEPSTFNELLTLSRAMQGPGFYREDEDHHYCELIYNNNNYYVIRYEMAKEWFEYRFTGQDHLYFEEDNGRLIIRDDSYSGPEGMLMPYNFIAFVDNSCKFLILVGGGYDVPIVSDADINAFKNFYNEPSYDVPDETMPVFESMEIDYVPADNGRIIPIVTEYVEDRWYKENSTFHYSFISLDGEYVSGAFFDWVSYSDEANAYIVRRTSGGVSKYGFLSDDGALFTGLVFDGAACAMANAPDNVCFYGTNYADGHLWVSSIDESLNVVDSVKITCDENELSLKAKNAQLSVVYINDRSAVMINRDQYYYSLMLVNNLSGKFLYNDKDAGLNDVSVFGDVIIEQFFRGQGVKVYDMDGNLILYDENAYTGMLTEDRFMIARDTELEIYDTNWQVVISTSIPSNSEVMTSFGQIAVDDGKQTLVYNKDLVLVNKLDYSLGDGTYLRDWRGYGEGAMFYDTITDEAEIINLNNGARMRKESHFSYGFKEGYIIATNSNYGNVPAEEWRVYDQDFNLLLSGEGTVDSVRDEASGDVFIVVEYDDMLTLYSMPDLEEMFSFAGNIWTLKATDGRFHCWDTDCFILLDSSGEEIVTYNVFYSKKG